MSQRFLSKNSRMFRLGIVLIVFAGLFGLTPSQAHADTAPWMDTSLAPEKRASLLVAAMTLDEKLAMVHGDKGGMAGGFVGHISAIPRLNIPELNMKDGPAGVGNGAVDVTGFPAPITVAAAWDVALTKQYATFMAEEQRGKGVNVHLAPMMNIDRTPSAGRNFEGYGEDPYLSARMAEMEVLGIQSTGLIAVAKHFIGNEQEFQRTTISSEIDLRTLHEIYLPPFKSSVDAGVGSIMCSYNKVNGVYACENPDTQNDLLKGELGFKGWVMSDWDATHSTIASPLGGLDMEMPLGTYFGYALQGAVVTNKVSLARLDDMVLRIFTSMFKADIFDRAPVGSPGANVQTDEHKAFTRTAAAAGMVLLKNDQAVLPLDSTKIKTIAVFGGAADVDPVIVGGGSGHVNAPYAVSPLNGIIQRAGSGVSVHYFDVSRETGQPIAAEYFQGLQAEFFNSADLSGKAVKQTAANIDFAWKAAPVSGINAANWSARWSGTIAPKVSGMYNLTLSGAGSSRLYIDDKLVIDNWGSKHVDGNTVRRRLIPQKVYSIRVEYSQPADAGDLHLSWYIPSADPAKDAAIIASKADVAIVVTGVNSNEGNDRQTLGLPDDNLIKAVLAANPHTVVVVYGPSQVLMPWADQVPAILFGWIPGQEAGNALADVLFGDVNPSGRLPVTLARSENDYPANTPETYPGVGGRVLYAEGLNVGYRHFDSKQISPLFPFGHGLSYTKFAYSKIRISPDADGNASVAVDIQNIGSVAGTEVAQLYVSFPPEASEPPQQLKGFQKISLKPGETQTVTFKLSRQDMSFWSAGLSDWVVYPGAYQVLVGASSRDIRQHEKLDMQGGLLAGTVIQAESATLAGGAVVAKDAAGFTGTGYVGELKRNNASATLNVTASEAGSYTLTVRYASKLRPGEQNKPRTISLVVNGGETVQLGLPNLANWDMWDFKSQVVDLKAGENTITYFMGAPDNADVYIDSILLEPVAETAPDATAIAQLPVQKASDFEPGILLPIGVIVLILFFVFLSRQAARRSR